MKILTQEEVEKLEFVIQNATGKTTPFLIRLKEMEIGENILITKEEWPIKSAPCLIIGQTFRKARSEKKFNTRTLKDGSGWVVKRIK